ncbi:MAG: RHS repeat-associated core domain-containing protein, partial [Reinekea sp.]
NHDPIGLMGGLNAYQYCPNPVGWVDPLGLSCKEEDSTLHMRGTVAGPGERALTQDQYKSLMSQYRNQGNKLQAELDTTISQQEYVYRAAKLRDIENYQAANSISGRNGVPTYMSTDYVGTDPSVLMDKGQIFTQWGEPEVLLKIPTSALDTAKVPRPLGNSLSTGWEPLTEFYPAAGSGGMNQFMGRTNSWDDSWAIPLEQN